MSFIMFFGVFMDNKPDIFNMAGVLPPYDPLDATGFDRSPYIKSILDLVDTYGYTPERCEILKGFLEYRTELYKKGIVSGFQWLNGSFTTDIETLENRPPNDIDVVTFFDLPTGQTQTSFLPLVRNLFTPKSTKKLYKVDAYAMVLGQTLNYGLIQWITYWYSMWSHRKKDNIWKGYLQVPLSPLDDQEAIQILTLKEKSYEC